MSQVQDTPTGNPVDPAAIVRDRIRQGREDRKRYEPTWLSSLAFSAGKHYHQYDRFTRTMMLPPNLEQDVAKGNLYTADVITERRMRALGELTGEDDRPELLLVDDGDTQEDFQAQLNRAVGYGWDHEWHGDEALIDVYQKVIDLGTAAIRVRFDSTVGNVKEEVPHYQGKPLLDPDQARELMAGGPRDDVQIKPVREGRIRWESLSPFNLLVPPGVENDADFPWEVVVRPVALAEVKARYGAAAASLVEDTDIANVMGLDTRADSPSGTGDAPASSGTATSRLRDHVWVFTYYERPTAEYEQGRTLVLAGAQMLLMTPEPDPLPYCAPDGTYRSGITYFHWWRVTGRFWSRSLVEPMKDIQRRINKRSNQLDKTLDRSTGFVMVDKNSKAHARKGFPLEVIALEPSERQPVVVPPLNVGDTYYRDKDDAIGDLERASGIGQSALGENPENTNTYSQLALLNEQESSKRSVIRRGLELGRRRLVEDSVHDIRTYWGPDKQILLDSDDDRVQSRVFNATKVPTFFVVRAAKGAAKPRSQAAEIQKVTDLWQAVLASQAVTSNPQRWIRWYRESLDAGQVLDLPEEPNDSQVDKADLENHLLAQGEPVQPAYYDIPQVHIPSHRDAQIEADMAGDVQTVAALEEHIQAHLAMAREVAQQQAALEAPAQVQGELEQQQTAQQPPQPAAS